MEKRRSLLGHHLAVMDYYMANGFSGFEENNKEYGPEFVKRSKEIYMEIINDPDIRIKIVWGFDDICNSGCPFKETAKKCDPDWRMTDILVEERYGLYFGHEYTSADITGRIQRVQSLDLK